MIGAACFALGFVVAIAGVVLLGVVAAGDVEGR